MPNKRRKTKQKATAQMVNAITSKLASVTIKAPAKSARRRRGKRSTALQPLSLAVQEKNIRGPRPVNMTGDPYVMCRLDPFSSQGSKGIPDGGNQNFVVVDHRVQNVVTDTYANGFVLQTFSTLPNFVGLYSLEPSGTQGLTVDGIKVGNQSTYFYPMGRPAAYCQNGMCSTLRTVDPYGAIGCRIVSMQVKVTYTGTLMNTAGVMTVSPNTFAFSPTGTVFESSSAVGAAIVYSSNDGQSWTTDNGLKRDAVVYTGEGETSPVAFTKDSQVYRVGQTVYLTPKRVGTSYPIVPMSDQMPLLSIVSPSNPVIMLNKTPGFFTGRFDSTDMDFQTAQEGTYAIDNNWQHYQLVVKGYSPGSSFLVETAACVEYKLANTSPFADLAIKSSDYRPQAIAHADKVVANAKAGAPITPPRGGH